ncbi:MAG: PilN domain-containing protein [Gammaproteobacteria bacterium]|jgi:type IV pilus assembly protein PilN|nr:PilN domain-containing protein [Gammaproteobacteria bacterium]
MAHINLLPWREEQRQEQTRQFATITVLSMALTGAIIFMVHVMFNNQIEHQKYRNKILQDEIATLDASLKQIDALEDTKEQLLARMDVIQSLQQQRPQIVHLFDDFVRTVPEGIYLRDIKQEGDQLTIQGVAESNGRVSAYMRNIDSSDWMSTPKLKVIETKAGTLRSSDFTLITSQTSPDEKKQKTKGDES